MHKKSRIRSLKRPLCKPEFRVFLFFFGLALFNPPFLTIMEKLVAKGRSAALFIYLFLVWGIIVFLLFLGAAGDGRRSPTAVSKGEREE